MRRRRVSGLALLALPLAGCITAIAESRVESAFVNAGLSRPIASCMAGRMVDRLTISQLRRLEELQRPSGQYAEQSLGDYLDRVRRVGDPQVLAVTTSAAALCSTGLAR